MASTTPKPLVIIDTDVSTDGALALMLALHTRDLDVLAITIVEGRWGVDKAFDNLLRILQYFGKTRIPIFKGKENDCLSRLPLGLYEDEKSVPCFPGYTLPPAPRDALVSNEYSHCAMVRLAEQHKGNVSMIALGPLTNVAMAHLADKNFHKHLSRLYISGGKTRLIGGETTHANFNTDYSGAELVLRELKCPITIVTNDLLQECCVPKVWFNRVKDGPTRSQEVLQACLMQHLQFPVVPVSPSPNSPSKRDWTRICSCALLTMMTVLCPAVVNKRMVTNASVVERFRAKGILHFPECRPKNCDYCYSFDMKVARDLLDGMVEYEVVQITNRLNKINSFRNSALHYFMSGIR